LWLAGAALPWSLAVVGCAGSACSFLLQLPVGCLQCNDLLLPLALNPRSPPSIRRFKKYAGLDNYPPLQIMFATKGKNKGKLDSHCWYFDAFCYLLQPEYCVLFDAGERLPWGVKKVQRTAVATCIFLGQQTHTRSDICTACCWLLRSPPSTVLCGSMS
jgi:hypothetical protein